MGWGVCMAGCDQPFRETIEALLPLGHFTYVEVGIAEGNTLETVCRHLEQHGVPWSAYGVDTPGLGCHLETVRRTLGDLVDRVVLTDEGSPQWFHHYDGHITLAFIDGCHERECVAADFLGLAAKVIPGGRVIFHDSDETILGNWPQAHRGLPVGVRWALADLGLLQGTRPGWRTILDKPANPDGRGWGMFIVERG